MQLGNNPVDKMEAALAERLAGARGHLARGGSTFTRPQVDTLEDMHHLSHENVSPLDVASQVYKFPGKLYDEADQGVRGLIDLAHGLYRGDVDLGDAAEAAAAGTVDSFKNTLMHPVTQANENPLEFMGNASAVAGGIGGLNSFLAGRMPVEGPMAIGALGKRLEAGDLPSELKFNSYFDQESSANPYLLDATWDDGTQGQVVAKLSPAERNRYSPIRKEWVPNIDQALNEAAANELGNSYARMPGVAMHPEIPTPSGRTAPGSLIEYLDDVHQVDDVHDLDWANPEVMQQGRAMNMLDRVLGNDDRSPELNYFATGGPEEEIPVAMDQGYGLKMNNRNHPASMHTPQAWGDRTFTPQETEWLQRMKAQLYHPTGAIDQVQAAVRAKAIDRIDELLAEGQWQPKWDLI